MLLLSACMSLLFCPLAVGKEKKNPALEGQTHSYGNIEGSLTSLWLPETVGCLKKSQKNELYKQVTIFVQCKIFVISQW